MLQAMTHAFLLATGLIMLLGVQTIFVFNQGASQKHLIQELPVVWTVAIIGVICLLVNQLPELVIW